MVKALMHMEFIRKLGGITTLAKALGLGIRAVSNWTKRGIPWRWRTTIAEIAAEQGVELPPDFLKPPRPDGA